ncbi:MAG TPA: SDR family oxidoreductase [Acidimicrobiales bacterium]|jgi:3alpha(or 20beta)-hydroxysteroid dehydrogenase|nr:SDR family oxidoreductase [Acidimicrobiales bacterium]
MGRLEGRVAIVTGCARGTGEAITRRFVAEGAQVLGLDVLDERGAKVAADLGGAAVFRHGDITSETDWTRAVDDATSRFGRIDVLVNNAAILHLAALDQTSAEVFAKVLEVNVIGAFLGIKACLPALRAAGGSVVNVGSVDSISGTPTTAAYTSSKFALRGLTKVVALEEAKHRVRCNIVCPGGGNPEMVSEFFVRYASGHLDELPAGRPVEPPPLGRATLEDIAAAVLYFASDDSTSCTGTELVVDGGMHAGQYVDIPGLFSTR